MCLTHCVGWRASDLTLFLWLVRTALVLPAARSHSQIVQSWLPVTTWTIEAGNLNFNSETVLQMNPCPLYSESHGTLLHVHVTVYVCWVSCVCEEQVVLKIARNDVMWLFWPEGLQPVWWHQPQCWCILWECGCKPWTACPTPGEKSNYYYS